MLRQTSIFNNNPMAHMTVSADVPVTEQRERHTVAGRIFKYHPNIHEDVPKDSAPTQWQPCSKSVSLEQPRGEDKTGRSTK